MQLGRSQIYKHTDSLIFFFKIHLQLMNFQSSDRSHNSHIYFYSINTISSFMDLISNLNFLISSHRSMSVSTYKILHYHLHKNQYNLVKFSVSHFQHIQWFNINIQIWYIILDQINFFKKILIFKKINLFIRAHISVGVIYF